MSNANKPKEPLLIVKVGGKVVENPTALQKLIKDFVAIKCKKLLVHGGGSTGVIPWFRHEDRL